MFSPVLYLFVDMCAVRAIGMCHLSPLLLPHPFITLWGGGLLRACLFLFLTATYPGTLPWMSSLEGVQTIGVLCSLYPVYISLLWTFGVSTLDQLWGWHSWQGVNTSLLLFIISLLFVTIYN